MKAPAIARDYLAMIRRRFGTDSASAIEWMETDRAQNLYIAANARRNVDAAFADKQARMIALAIAHARAQAAKPVRKPNTNARVDAAHVRCLSGRANYAPAVVVKVGDRHLTAGDAIARELQRAADWRDMVRGAIGDYPRELKDAAFKAVYFARHLRETYRPVFLPR